jgi:hypothetical protein
VVVVVYIQIMAVYNGGLFALHSTRIKRNQTYVGKWQALIQESVPLGFIRCSGDSFTLEN